MSDSLASALTRRLAAATVLATLIAACNAADAVDEFGTTPLMRAARRGDTTGVYRLLKEGADVNATVPRRDVKEFIADVAKLGELPKWDAGFTPLLYAVKAGQSRVARILIDSGANVSAAARYGETPLGFALARNDIDLVSQLTRAGAAANPVQFAKVVTDGPAELVQVLAQRGADVNGKAPADQMRGRPVAQPLVIAATLRGDTGVLKALIDAGVQVNARDHNGWTALRWARDPEAQGENARLIATISVLETAGARDDAGSKAESLFAAVRKNDVVSVRNLLGGGANPNARDKRGVTVLIVAARAGSADVVKALVAAGAQTNVVPQFGYSPLTAAVESGSLATVRALLTSGAKSDQRDGHGWSPLFVASRLRSPELAEALLADSARIDVATIRMAARLGDTAIVQLLLDHGADPTSGAALVGAIHGCGNVDNTPVIRLLLKHGARPRRQFNVFGQAALYCRAGVLRLLLASGADPNEREDGGYTPLMYAAMSGKLENVQVLLDAGADPKARTDEGMFAYNFATRKHPQVAQLLVREAEGRGSRRKAGVEIRP